jgi:hypothetical protein
MVAAFTSSADRRTATSLGAPVRSGRALRLLLLSLLGAARAPYDVPAQNKRLVLNVNFETAKDYDITSAYAVRGWNTTEGHMRITCPSPTAKHGGRFGMQILVDRAFTKNFHAQARSCPRAAPSPPRPSTRWSSVPARPELTRHVCGRARSLACPTS